MVHSGSDFSCEPFTGEVIVHRGSSSIFYKNQILKFRKKGKFKKKI